jgi:hypothetical protein
MKHTPGPWKISTVRDGDGTTNVYVGTDYPPGRLCDGSRSIATMTGSAYTKPGEFHQPQALPTNTANAARIVACVNACEGIADPATTIPELLRGLEDAIRSAEALDRHEEPDFDWIIDARTAIAKAKGVQS